MKIYLKGFYGYKNFGDEMLFFGLLNYLQKEYNPESFTVDVGNIQRMQERTNNNKTYLDTGILDKLEFIEKSQNNKIISRILKRIGQILNILGFDKYKNHLKVFGGGEVLDESRPFPYNGRNLPILHFRSITKKQFILVGGIGSDHKKSTKYLYKYLLPKAQKIICREEESMARVKNYIKKHIKSNKIIESENSDSRLSQHPDFSNEVLLNTIPVIPAEAGISETENRFLSTQEGQLDVNNTILINVGPKYFTSENINKIKKYVSTHVGGKLKSSQKHKIIFFPADINYDKQFYSQLRQEIPDLEIYDRTKHSLIETINLFKSCNGGVGSRLHFLYPLKVFKKDFVSISDSDKVKKMI